MEGRFVLKALRSSWWLIVAGLVLGVAAGLSLSLLQTPVYTSQTQLFVSTTATVTSSDAFQGGQFSEQRVASYAQLLRGNELAGRIIDELGLDETPRELTDRISVSAIPDTVLLDVGVTDASPERAQRIAEVLGEQFAALVAELEAPQGNAADAPIRVTVTDQADLALTPSAPRTQLNTILGAVAGLLFGMLGALVRFRLDRTVHDAEDAAVLAGAPVIGVILRDESLEERHVLERNSLSRTAEGYRQLRTNLQFLNVDEPPKVIMISSAVPSEGKTTLAINLAVALAEAGRSVTIIEADLRRPRVTRYLGMVGGVGLTNILTGSADLDDVVQPYGAEDLSVIASGPTPPNPGELLSSSHMFSLIDDLRAKCDFVLLDAPPLLPVADASGLAVLVDGVVLSLRYGSTTKDQLAQTRDTLSRVGAKTLGVVLNVVPPKAEVTSAYGSGYTYGYDPDPSGPTSS